MQENNELNALLADTTVDEGAIAEALLNEIEMSVTQVEDDLSALVEEPLIEVLSVENDDAELGIDRAALYAEQGDGEMSVADPEDTVAVEHTKEDLAASTTGKKPRKARTPSSAGAPSSTPGVITTRSAALKKKADVSGLLSLGYTSEEVDDLMATIDLAPKKVGEKANNMIRYALGREHVSNFTRFTMLKLRDNPAGFTVPELVKMLQEERSYSVGTARSQAQQQSRLFGLFGMVSKDGSKIALDGDNALSKAVLSRLNGDPFIAAGAPATVEDEEGGGGTGCTEPAAEAPSPAPVLSRSQRRAAAKAAKEAAKQQEPEALAA